MAQANIEESVDMISSLPDSIIGHILSFLPTKVALSSCIFLNNSRWRDIFPYSSNLDFDESLLVNNPRHGYSRDRTIRFMDFVDRCFMLTNGTHIDRFRLKCSYIIGTSRIHSWIRAALCSNVRELDLFIGRRNLGDEYSHVFTSNTLVVLKLGAGFSLNATASVYFPCLKIIHLESITLAHKDPCIQRLVSSSPVLEDLLIAGCHMEDVSVLSLSSPSLKRFTIDKIYDYGPYKLVLDTPSLVYLEFAVFMRGHILKNLGSLREAHINISIWFDDGIDHHELLDGLGNVQSLYLDGKVERFLRNTLDVSEELPLLRNVTRLVLGRPFMDLSVVIKLLQYFPNLEEFVSRGSIHGGYDVPCCVPSRLKSIECLLVYVEGTSQHKEVEPLEYFLKNANMLEKMQIRVRSYCLGTHCEVIEKLETMMVTMNELAKAPSRSKTCEINVFCYGKRVIFSK